MKIAHLAGLNHARLSASSHIKMLLVYKLLVVAISLFFIHLIISFKVPLSTF